MLRNGAEINSKVGGDWGEDNAIATAIPAQIIIIIAINNHTHVAIFIFYRASSICFSPVASFIATAEVSLRKIYILFGL
jgi:hypothetical protein